MKKTGICIFILSITVSLFSQNHQDTVVTFPALKFHSEFEKEALSNYVLYKKDTFNLFLAIEKDMSKELADQYKSTYKSIFTQLYSQKIDTKNVGNKIKMVYKAVHSQFLQKYNENEYFPAIFNEGTYNCVTASLLFAQVFDQLKIPYKVMSSTDHIYLVANPGKNSIVIETTNPGFENAIFNGDFKDQYVNHLRESKLISEADYKNKSVEEIFATKFNDLKESTVANLPGFQYYNKALTNAKINNIDEAYELAQKAYFFYQDAQVKNLFYTTLAYKIEKCEFNKLEDVDLLAQFIRFNPSNLNEISKIFDVMLAKNLQYTDRSKNIDSYYQRLKSEITDKDVMTEIGFAYNMTMAYSKRYDLTGSNYYARNALKFKPNQKDAILLFQTCLENDLKTTTNTKSYLDSLNLYSKELDNVNTTPLIDNCKLKVYLKIAGKSLENKNPADAEKYLKLFEESFQPPVKDIDMKIKIENVYYEYACYYAKKNKAMTDKIISRGMKYIPGSNLLQSAKTSQVHISRMMIAPD